MQELPQRDVSDFLPSNEDMRVHARTRGAHQENLNMNSSQKLSDPETHEYVNARSADTSGLTDNNRSPNAVADHGDEPSAGEDEYSMPDVSIARRFSKRPLESGASSTMDPVQDENGYEIPLTGPSAGPTLKPRRARTQSEDDYVLPVLPEQSPTAPAIPQRGQGKKRAPSEADVNLEDDIYNAVVDNRYVDATITSTGGPADVYDRIVHVSQKDASEKDASDSAAHASSMTRDSVGNVYNTIVHVSPKDIPASDIADDGDIYDAIVTNKFVSLRGRANTDERC